MNVQILAEMAEKKLSHSPAKDAVWRKDFLSKFKSSGLKEVTQDSYKFTNLETFFSNLAITGKSFEQNLEIQSDYPVITLVNGMLQKHDSLPQGVTITKISDKPELIRPLMTEANALSNLHHGLFENGILIEVTKNCQVEIPLRIINTITQSDISSPTHLVLAHPHSKVCVIEETKCRDISHANISETYIQAMDGAHVEHISLHEEANEALNHVSIFSEISKDATVKSFIFHTAGKMNRTNLTLNMNAPGSNGESYGLFLTNGSEHSDINTEINHKAPDTTSNQMVKGILDENSKGIFTGKIHIFPKAQRVFSGQLNKNLLLSKKAQVHSQPQLEIFADDVKCSHGSTTGQLSPEEIFYFEARGIPAEKARNLLAFGFGLEIVQKITNLKAQEFISTIIKENLVNKFSFGRVL